MARTKGSSQNPLVTHSSHRPRNQWGSTNEMGFYLSNNSSYDSSGFDQPQPPQDSVDHQGILQVLNKMEEKLEEIIRDRRKKTEDMSIEEMMHEQQLVDREIKEIINDLGYKRFRSEEIDEVYKRDCEIRIQKLKQDFNEWGSKVRKKEQAYEEEKYSAACRYMLSITCDDEDDYIPLAITTDLPTEVPEDSLIMEDEHLDTILEMESDEFIKSSVENLVKNPSESTDLSDGESDDDESLSDEDVPKENFKIYSNPLCDNEEIIFPKIDPHSFNAESNLIDSMLNRDTNISPKINYLLKEFSGELAHINPIPPGIEEADFDLEEEIRLVKNLSYDKSSPRPPEELNSEIADTIIESLSPSPIPVEDSDSHMEEISLFLAFDDLIPSCIENDDYDSEGDIHFLEELLNNDSLPLPENESSNFDHHDDPLSPRPCNTPKSEYAAEC
ncbi:hypothetical protein Tco_1355541 [Tanacetum coccineum]